MEILRVQVKAALLGHYVSITVRPSLHAGANDGISREKKVLWSVSSTVASVLSPPLGLFPFFRVFYDVTTRKVFSTFGHHS